MCTVPKRHTALQMIAVVVVLLIVLASCGGGDYPAEPGMACTKVAVPIIEMRRECHAVGTDECAYMTTEQYTFKAVSYECKQKEQ